MGVLDDMLDGGGNKSGGVLDDMVDKRSEVRQGPSRRAYQISDMVRPALTGIGTAVGGVLGATAGGAAGLAGGPAAPGTVPYGATVGGVAGAGLGYATGNKLADLVDRGLGVSHGPQDLRTATKTTLRDIGTGASMEMGGQALGKAIPIVARTVRHPVTAIRGAMDKQVAKSAVKGIESAKTTTPQVAAMTERNLAEAGGVAKRVGGGWRVAPGQASDNVGLLALQRRLNVDSKTAQSLFNEQNLVNTGALRDYLEETIAKGGSVDDVLSAIAKHKKTLEAGSATAARTAESTTANLATMGKRESGQTLREGAATVKDVMRKKADTLYKKVPTEMEIDSTPLYRRMQELTDEMDPAFQLPRVNPTATVGRGQRALQPKPMEILGADGLPYNAPRMAQDIPERMTFGQIKDYRTQVTTLEREARTAGNYDLARKYGQLREGIDDTLTLAEQSGQGSGVQALRDANAFYRDTYVPTVRQGATSKVLAKDKTGAQRVEDALVGSEYFKPGQRGVAAAESFTRTFGNNPAAKQTIRDHAANDLLDYARNPVTGEINSSRVAAWMQRHKSALDGLGLGNEFSTVQKAAQAADKARALEAGFNKSRFGKAIDADPDKALSYMFGGENSRNSVRAMDSLLGMVKGDAKALAGLKRSFADMLTKRMEDEVSTGITKQALSQAQGRKMLQQFEPAMRKLYTPKELQALKDVQKAVEIGARINKNSSGLVGSHTAELTAKGTEVLRNFAPLNPKMRIVRIIGKVVSEGYENQVNEYMAKLMYDPVEAARIMQIAHGAGKQAPNKSVAEFIKAMTIYTGAKATAKRDDEEIPSPE